MIVPHAIEAERAVVGAMLMTAEAVAEAATMLHPEDFGQPVLGSIFTACLDLWKVGQRPDATLVGERLRAAGVTFENPDLISLMADAPSLNPAPHARLVAEYATRRRGIALADEMRERFANPGVDVADTIDRTKAELEVAQLPSAVSVNDVVSVQTFTETPDDPLSWVIPGLLDEQDRMIVVAGEGAGKSVLSRWLAASAAQGLHPFTLTPSAPATTLIVDLENPARIVRKTLRPMVAVLSLYRGEHYDPARCWIWHRPGGIDLRTRAGAAELDAVCSRVRPRLVCLGPLYKSYRADSGKREHDVASEVAAVFDDLRTRYGFALVIEHHAPLKQGGFRELRPFGSLLWSQWPEIGLTLNPTDETMRTLEVGFYRGSRDARRWPSTLTRGLDGTWPWDAYYPNGAA